MKIISIDAGNTHLRVAIFDMRSTSKGEIVHITKDTFATFFQNLFTQLSSDTSVIISTVTDLVKCWIPDELKQAGHTGPCLWSDISYNTRITNNYSDTVGIDRLVDAIAAADRFRNENCIIIDSGTATTVDFLTKESVLLGGYILPGIGLKAKVITEGTDKLPPIDPYKLTIETPPIETISAIASGLLLDSAGGIEKAIRKGFEILESPKIIGCGGGWDIIGPYVEFDVVTEPDLTLWGTALMGYDTICSKEK